jgi:DNA-binding MarR family transcriptional regulator
VVLDLTKDAGLSPVSFDAAVARSLKQLETRDLIRREIDASNQRTKKVYAQAAGDDCKKEMDRIMDHWNSTLLDGLSESEVEAIVAMLQQLRRQAVDIDIEGVIRGLD